MALTFALQSKNWGQKKTKKFFESLETIARILSDSTGKSSKKLELELDVNFNEITKSVQTKHLQWRV